MREQKGGKLYLWRKDPFRCVYSPFHVEENTFVVRDTGEVDDIWQAKGEFGQSLGCDPLHMYVASKGAKQSAFASVLWPTVAKSSRQITQITQVRDLNLRKYIN